MSHVCTHPPRSSRHSNPQDLDVIHLNTSGHPESAHGSSSTKPAQVGDAPRSAKERLDEYCQTKGKTLASVHSEVMNPEDATLVQCLALQSYHLPGYTWKQDWRQYMLNNHPVLGVFCHHPKHPIKACTRVVAMIGTIVVGLAITNLFYLFFILNPQYNRPLVTVMVEEEPTTTLTTGMLLLWTVGGGVHTMYNLLQWHIAACACCRPGGMCERQACCPSLGKHLLRVLTLVIISMAILIILLRVAIGNSRQELPPTNNSTDIHFLDDDSIEIEVHDVSEFNFLIGYLVEMGLALFVYYPLGGTVLFSGILGCGRIPLLGGRPLEVAQEERRLARKQKQKETTCHDVEVCVPVEHRRDHEFD